MKKLDIAHEDKKSFSSMNLLSRPQDDIMEIYTKLKEHCTFVQFKPRSKFIAAKDESSERFLCFLISGIYDIYRISDDLLITSWHATEQTPEILGMLELHNFLGHFYINFPFGAAGYIIPTSKATLLLDKFLLWRQISRYQSHILAAMSLREQGFIGRSSYECICNALIEYHVNVNNLESRKAGTVSFICSTTSLSKSQVHAVIKELIKGGFIEMNRGKLIKINNLPRGF